MHTSLNQAALLRETYEGLLYTEYLEDTQQRVCDAAAQHTLQFHNQTVCSVLRPFFLDVSTERLVLSAAESISRAITRLTQVVHETPAMWDTLCLSTGDEQRLRMTPSGQLEVIARLDGFLDDHGTLRFIEYNTGTPGGHIFTDRLCDMFSQLPLMQRLSANYHFKSSPIGPLIPPALLEAVQHGGITGPLHVGMIKPGNAGALDPEALTELLAVRQLLVDAGCTTTFVSPSELERRDGVLCAGEHRLNVALVLDWEDFNARTSPTHDFWHCVRDKSVFVVNSFANWAIRGNKALFALLTDPEYAPLFDGDSLAAIRAHIPWTRRVQSGRTTGMDGTQVDLLPYILAHRRELVLKPATSFGGKGVVLGFRTEPAQWEAALASEAHSRPYVVQERVDLGQESFPCLIDGRVEQRRRFFDCNPFIWNGARASGILIRLSDDPLLNVTAGTGSIAAVCSVN